MNRKARRLALMTMAVGAGLLARPVFSQDAGTLTHNGTVMTIKGVVAVWDAKGPSLKLHLLPFVPSPAEIALIQKNDTMWLFNKPSPDLKKWPHWVPRATLSLSWSFEPQGVGDVDKSWYHLYAFGIGAENSNLNFNAESKAKLHATLTGPVKEGGQITLTAKGEDTLSKDKLAWDLKVTAKIVPVVAK